MSMIVWAAWGTLVAYTIVGAILDHLSKTSPEGQDDDLAQAIVWDRDNPGVIAQD